MVFGQLERGPRAERVAAALARLRAKPEDVERPLLLGAWRGERLAGAMLVEPQAGRTAVLQMPRLARGEPNQTAALLVQEACARLAGQGLCLVQALLGKDGLAEDEWVLKQAGFARLAELFYLVCLKADFPREPPAGPISWESYSPSQHVRFSQLVEATYQHTLDCPALNGVREIDDVLAGYRATGRFDPAHWLIARHGAEDVGCLILADHPDHGNMELVYMGLVPSARGRALGRHLVRHAQWLAHRAGRGRLVLAVDANNVPAVRIYAQSGFEAWERRIVYVRLLQAARASGGVQ